MRRMKILGRLDSPGGHIAVCVALILIGMAAAVAKVPKVEDVVIFALGALGRSMLGETNDRD